MLSYKTIIALQLLQIIHDGRDEGYTVTELKYFTGLQGAAVSQTAFELKREGWLGIKRNYRYQITSLVEDASLYDLVMAIDGQIQLDTHVGLDHWGHDADIILGKAMELNQNIHDTVKAMLQKIKLSNMLRMKKKIDPAQVNNIEQAIHFNKQ